MEFECHDIGSVSGEVACSAGNRPLDAVRRSILKMTWVNSMNTAKQTSPPPETRWLVGRSHELLPCNSSKTQFAEIK